MPKVIEVVRSNGATIRMTEGQEWIKRGERTFELWQTNESSRNLPRRIIQIRNAVFVLFEGSTAYEPV